ncbi:MAG TPA: cytochrome c biogenesis protein CcdA, partial [bacterium]|nr:cytochrome c biogenesis protein CcdA [bacterium]
MKRTIFAVLTILLTQIFSAVAYSSISTGGPFSVHWNDESKRVRQGESFTLSVEIRVPEGHYLYAEETDIDFSSFEGLIVTDVHYPQTVRKRDPFFNRLVKAYDSDVHLKITGRVPDELSIGEREVVANVSFQGCSDKICFRPEMRVVTFLVDVIKQAPVAEKESGRQSSDALKSAKSQLSRLKSIHEDISAGRLAGGGIALTLLLVFLAGILTSLTPCVWPIIPTVLVFVGVHPHKKFLENMLLSFCLTLGISIVYSVLGLLAVGLGKNLGFLFQSRIFLAAVVLFFVAMSLSMFGLFEVRLPCRWHVKLHALGGDGYLGSFFAGMGLGLIASPCAGPVLMSMLGYVALQRDYLLGFAVLMLFSMGMGLLFIALGAGFGELTGKLRGGKWTVWIRRMLGVLILIPALFYGSALISGSCRIFHQAVPDVEWLTDVNVASALASRERRPMMVYFSAKWCPPCRKLDCLFWDEELARLTYRLVPLKIDTTVETPDIKAIMDRYGVIGMPSIIFTDPDGRIYADIDIADYGKDSIRSALI